MKTKTIAILLVLLTVFSCKTEKPRSEGHETVEAVGDINPNQPDKNAPVPTYVFMQNRMGIRIEMNLTSQELSLWISPLAGVSNDIFDRNYSNRDDHTSLFDRITFPNLPLSGFDSCSYDPFYSVLYYGTQTMHLLSLYDEPMVLLWFEQPEKLDIKTDKADRIVTRSRHQFVFKHPDRRYTFDYVARMFDGAGYFQHQLDTAYGRSTYTRAHLSAGQPIVIAGKTEEENVREKVEEVCQQTTGQLVAKTQEMTAENLRAGQLVLQDDKKLQRFYRTNKKCMLAEMDASGQLKASIRKVGHLPYMRDGGWAFTNAAYTGWPYPVKKWTDFLMANPTVIVDEEPKGKMFGQLVGPITKWEEDGINYAIWSAFAYYTQTADNEYNKGENWQLLTEITDWLERYCYDPERKLFYRYYYTETAYRGSRDDGYDNAIGCISTMWPPKNYKDKVIKKAYDIFINTCCYSNYLMLAGMSPDEQAAEVYVAKARALEPGIREMFRGKLPDYGLFITARNEKLRGEPYGISKNDYIWGNSVPVFYPDPFEMIDVRQQLFKNMMADLKGHFAATFYSLLNKLDPMFHSEQEVMEAVKVVAEAYYLPGKRTPMPFTLGEQTVVEDGDYYTDIRPMAFPTGPMMYAITGLGVRRLPYGIAVRANQSLNQLKNYHYQGKLIDFSFSKSKGIPNVQVNGKKLAGTLQIPLSMLAKDKNTIAIEQADEDAPKNTMVWSTIRLNDYHNGRFEVKAFGKNQLIFHELDKKVLVQSKNGIEVPVETKQKKAFTLVEFQGYGEFSIELN